MFGGSKKNPYDSQRGMTDSNLRKKSKKLQRGTEPGGGRKNNGVRTRVKEGGGGV